MKLTITESLYIAGAIVLGSVITSQFQHAEFISSTILVVVSMFLLVWGYQKDKAKRNCALTSKSKRKKIFVTAGVLIVFGLLGFTVGRLIYLWSHI